MKPNLTNSKEAKKLLVKQVASSHYFARSARLREMFVFLCDEVLEHSADEIHEQEVGRRVFSRPPDYDTAADNTVRVHASMLRKRVNQYFSVEGSTEPLIIEIPRGNYAPVFRERPATPVEDLIERNPLAPFPLEAAGATAVSRNRSWTFWLPTALALVFAGLSAFLFFRPIGAPAPLPRTVKLFWSQLLPPGKPADLVIGDAALEIVQEMTDRVPVPLAEYYDRSYISKIGDRADVGKIDRGLANALILKRQSSFGDVAQILKVSDTARSLQSDIRMRFARDYSFHELKADNAILLGYSTSNPWIEPFENQLTLHWKFDPTQNSYLPVDATGALQTLVGQPGQTTKDGYATLSLLPNLGNSGNVLIVSGTGGSAMGAALDFLTNEHLMAELHGQLTADKAAPFPPFEALIKVGSRSTLPRDATIIAVRKLKH